VRGNSLDQTSAVTELFACLLTIQAEAPGPEGAPLVFLQLVAAAFVAWYLLALWVWSRYRAVNQPWTRILFGGWVLLDQQAFRSEGLSWLRLVRWTFLLVIIPLALVLLWRWPA
jgi:hypothetical protein